MAKTGSLTKKDVMDVLMEFHEKVNEPVMNDVLGRIGKLEKGVNGLEKEVGGLKKEVGGLKKEMDQVHNDIARIERKLDAVTDHQAEVLDQHGREIGRLKLAAN